MTTNTEPRVIKNKNQHRTAIGEINRLMNLEKLNKDDTRKLETLGYLAAQYEKEEFPIDAPGPVDVVKFYMDQFCLKSKDLADCFGSAPRVSEFFNGKQAPTIETIRRLHEKYGVPTHLMLGPYSREDFLIGFIKRVQLFGSNVRVFARWSLGGDGLGRAEVNLRIDGDANPRRFKISDEALEKRASIEIRKKLRGFNVIFEGPWPT